MAEYVPTIGEMAEAWMAHLGYSPEEVSEAKRWTPPSARLQPEESQEPPVVVRDMDMACDFAREIVLPMLAAHDATVKAEALREAEARMDDIGQNLGFETPADAVRAMKQIVRRMADRIEADS